MKGERELFIHNLMVRIHFIIEIIWSTGLAPWEFEYATHTTTAHTHSASGTQVSGSGRVLGCCKSGGLSVEGITQL
jgi:hypothetical protein